MTHADWLMLTLAVYFHDLGMTVTKAEYGNRNASSFLDWRTKLLSQDESRIGDLKSRLTRLDVEDRERFLYSEFIRDNHALRVAAWIRGEPARELGVAEAVYGVVAEVLASVDRTFRRDLALVCQSHHEDDLDNLERYRVSRPYGATEAETANLQYTALILRTVDLLHLTRDRTPTVAYRIINPADPISQREWAKHRAIRSVRPKPALNDDGEVDPRLPTDTIEVHAHFEDEKGFFGLSAFLDYAEGQLKQSYSWAISAEKRFHVQHHFPWPEFAVCGHTLCLVRA
jgi:hypothetical protein